MEYTNNISFSRSTVDIGFRANRDKHQQGSFAVAVGYSTANQNQGECSIAIGKYAGRYNQGPDSIAIGCNSGVVSQGKNAIAIGKNTGTHEQHPDTVLISTGSKKVNSTSSNQIKIIAGDAALIITGGSDSPGTTLTSPLCLDELLITPDIPNVGFDKLYFKTDGSLYSLDSNGTETLLGGGSGGNPSSAFEYIFGATTSGDPGAGNVTLDANPVHESSTTMYISVDTDNSLVISLVLSSISVGSTVTIRDLNNSDKTIMFTVTAPPTDSTTYYSIPISAISFGSPNFTPADFVAIEIDNAGSGSSYNQDLNTFNSPTFDDLSLTGTLQLSSPTIRDISVLYTLATNPPALTNSINRFDTSSGLIVATLPDAISNNGRTFSIFLEEGGNNLEISTSGADTIENNVTTSIVLTVQFQHISLTAVQTIWLIDI